MIIKEVRAKKIKNSRNEDTIEISVKSDIGKAKASAPAGKSKGAHEAEYFKGSVGYIVKKINSSDKLKGIEIERFDDLKKIEKVFDFGSNPRVALEYAILKNFKKPYKKFNFGYRHLAIPLGNAIGGGMHSKGRKKPDFQEFLVYVEHCKDFSLRVKINKLVYAYLKKSISARDETFKGERNDEGAWRTSLSNIEILDLLYDATKFLTKKIGYTIRIGIDVAASSFYKNGNYCYKNYSRNNRNVKLSKKEHVEFLVHLVKKYNIGYLEDPIDEEHFHDFKELKKKVRNCLIVGDDLTVTNFERVKKAKGSINGIIIKPNQIGSLIEVKKVVDFCKLNRIKIIFSHRSGETKEDFLADLSYMFGADLLKAGIYGKERIVKYNRLRKIK
jgi:enolase